MLAGTYDAVLIRHGGEFLLVQSRITRAESNQ